MKTIVQLVEEQKEYFLEKDTAAKQAVEANIAPVETDPSSASRAYVVGEQLILNDVLYDVTSSISVGNAIAVGTNITAANKLSADIKSITNQANDMVNVLGAKNLLNPIDYHGFTMLGVTSTINSDGTISLSGTATSSDNLPITKNWDIDASNLFDSVIGQEVILSDGTDANTYIGLILKDANGAQVVHPTTNNGEVKFTISQKPTAYSMYYNVVEGVDYTGVVIKPMIRPASITDDTYEPYAKTNQELTTENQTLKSETYNVNDTAITEVASDDLLPIYDTSASDKKKIAVSNFVGGLVSNPNLLDNPWFTVNQRGASSYTVDGYCVDRWMIAGTSVDKELKIVSDGLELKQNSAISDAWLGARQYIAHGDLIIGKKYTISILYADGTIKSAVSSPLTEADSYTRFASTDIYQDVNAIFDYQGNGGYFIVAIQTKSSTVVDTTIRAIKLEVGEVSTLAMDIAPNYTTELLKCQRYFYKTLQFDDNGMNVSPNQCLAVSATRLQGIKFPVQMRANPTVTVNEVNELGGSVTISGVASQWTSKEGISYFSITGATVGSLYVVDFEATADL